MIDPSDPYGPALTEYLSKRIDFGEFEILCGQVWVGLNGPVPEGRVLVVGVSEHRLVVGCVLDRWRERFKEAEAERDFAVRKLWMMDAGRQARVDDIKEAQEECDRWREEAELLAEASGVRSALNQRVNLISEKHTSLAERDELRAEVAALEKCCDGRRERAKAAEAERDKLRAEVDRLRSAISSVIEECKYPLAERVLMGVARAALEPPKKEPKAIPAGTITEFAYSMHKAAGAESYSVKDASEWTDGATHHDPKETKT